MTRIHPRARSYHSGLSSRGPVALGVPLLEAPDGIEDELGGAHAGDAEDGKRGDEIVRQPEAQSIRKLCGRHARIGALKECHRQKIREREQHDHDGRALLDKLVTAH